MVEHSEIKVTIKQSYFKGDYYLIEADMDGKSIFFEHEKMLLNNQSIFLSITNS